MNKDLFNEYVLHPASVDEEITGQLREVVQHHPYCQTARILYTIALFKKNSASYDSELKLTALYAGDRGVLRKRIFSANEKYGQIVLPDEHMKEPAIPVTETHEAETSPVMPTDEDKMQELKKIVQDRMAQIEEEQAQKQSEIAKEPKKTKSQLIDEFIQNEPGITRQKGTFFNPVSAARTSVVDQENIVSETLAKIYMDQGFYEKAIKTYQKLSLKFPEKSSYFAALIEKAKKELET